MPADPILHIDRRIRGLSFRLEGLQSSLDEPLWAQYTQLISDLWLHALQQDADRVLRSVAPTGLHDELMRLGLLLYENLVPEGIRPILREHTGSLYVWTEMLSIPWEILHDGEQFWGLRYQLGRRAITSVAPRARFGLTTQEEPSLLVVASDPHGDLSWVEEEVEAIVASFGTAASVNVLSDVRATTINVIRELRKGLYSVIHYCGHAVTEASTGEGALLLHDGDPLSSSTISSNLRGRPVVFLNACQSARGSSQSERSDYWSGITASLAEAFLTGGASGVIGTVADVGDREGTQFAQTFYGQILAGWPVGEAIRTTRQKFVAEQPDNPVWASFLLYGAPAAFIGRTPLVPSPDPTSAAPPEASTSDQGSTTIDERDKTGGEREDTWQQTVSRIRPAILHVETPTGAGTGFLIGYGGYAVTCRRVVGSARAVIVRFIDGKQAPAAVIATDSTATLVLLHIDDAPTVLPVRLARPEKIQEGQTVMAIGHPFGFPSTVSRGIVSSRCRVFDAVAYVQTDVGLNPGNSGGPLINALGEVLGVVSGSAGADTLGIGFAIALSHVRALLSMFRVP